MKFSLTCISALALWAVPTLAFNKQAIDVFKRVENRSPAAIIERTSGAQPFSNPELQKRASKFLTSKTKQFAVDGSGIPEVNFNIGESYAGLMPISGSPHETRKLFFWFFPSKNPAANEEIAIWFNGGPGCSSLSGLLTENGPFTWEAGTKAPVQNPYTWVNLTNMLWVEQPVGVGYSQGVPNITNEVELGLEFIGFYKQFVDTFGLLDYKVYLTGESYAGYYVPYIADAFITAAKTRPRYYNLKGIAINDPIIGDFTNQEEVVVLPYVEYWQNVFYLNDTFMETMRAKVASCGYTAYMEKYLTYPPPAGPFPVLPNPYDTESYVCDVWYDFYAAALEVNPCFNIYHITETCPHAWSQLGIVNAGDYDPPGEIVYFNRSDVKKALHAPANSNWMQCTDINVFGGKTDNQSASDTSAGPAQNGVLQRVIETTNNVIIGSGNLDFLLNTNGTLLAIQNMTWNGKQGLQSYPGTEFYVPYHPEFNGGALAGGGYLGYYGVERGLTFYQVQLSGHELPGYAPGAAYRSIELLLGRIKSLGEVSDFTTQQGNFTGSSTIYKRSEIEFTA